MLKWFSFVVLVVAQEAAAHPQHLVVRVDVLVKYPNFGFQQVDLVQLKQLLVARLVQPEQQEL
jgi:hypothetical protein